MTTTQIISTQRARLSSIRVQAPDSSDGQVWIQSSISATHKLPRGHRDDFSFARSDLIVIQNRGEDFCTLHIDGIACAESGLYIGSNRRAGVVMRAGQQFKLRMKPGEALTVRSLDMTEPVGTQPNGAPIAVRPGQSVVI